MNKRSHRTLFVLFQIFVSAALLFFLLRQVDVERLVAIWGSVRQPFLWLALALQLGGVLISALKWWLLLRASGQPMPYLWTVRIYLIGQFFSNFLPTQIGGDAVRVFYLTRRIGRPALALASPWGVRWLTRIKLPDVRAWQRRLRSFAESLAMYYAYPRTLALVIALALGYQLSWIAVNYAVTSALNLAAPLAFIAFMVP